MKIVITYHNFIRDFRGSLLLKHILEYLGHKVWVTPHWNRDIELISLTKADVVVGCQVAEKSTAYLGEFSESAGFHLVLNSSEQFTSPDNLKTFVTYDREKFNDRVISLQTIACNTLHQYIKNNDDLIFKEKYKYLGFPRYDISVDNSLRSVETKSLIERYQLASTKRRITYISSFLFEETFQDVPREDMDRWGYQKTINKNRELGERIAGILTEIAEKFISADDVLLIKKHPWDFSNFLEIRLSHKRIKFLKQSEYIVPCIDASDFVLHSFSTSAVEAWLMNKPTIAILPMEYRSDLNLSHMKYEIKTEGASDTIEALQDYPLDGPSEYGQSFLGGLADGRATIRLAYEIHRLPPPAYKRLPSIGHISAARARARHWLNQQGIGFSGRLAESARMKQNFASEESRWRIVRLYTPHFHDYVYRNRDYIKSLFDNHVITI